MVKQISNPNYNKGGTGGSLKTLGDDIAGLAIYSVAAMTSTIDLVGNVINLPNDMGTAFSSPNAPNPNNITIPNL